ncbi:MAG TPA: cytochrome c3 family protein [Gemmatimonadaceae bacterium]
MTRRLPQVAGVALVATVLALAGTPRPAASQGAGVVNCDKCHGNRDFIDRRRDRRRADTLMYVPRSALEQTAHQTLQCARCHEQYDDGYPHDARARVVPCQSCHEQAGLDWEASVHKANATTRGDAPQCTGCHGTHQVYPTSDRRSSTHPLNVAETCGRCHADERIIGTYFSTADKATASTAVAKYYETVHGHALTSAGLTVSATCNDCHRSHKVLPSDSLSSSIHRDSIPATCGQCHEGVVEIYDRSAHGSALVRGDTTVTGHRAPSCVDCHSGHGMVRADEPSWHTGAVEECGTCHEELYESYFDTYHGKVTRLGSDLAATCADCHSAHDMRPATDTASTVHPRNVVATCQPCHEGAGAGFVQFQTHADPRDREKNPQLHFTWLFMNALLIGVLGFFAIHTTLWLARVTIDYRRALRGGGSPPAHGGGSEGDA